MYFLEIMYKRIVIHTLSAGIRDENLRKAYNILHTEVQRTLKLNAYSEVNLTKLFESLMMKPQFRGP